jgi:hypothetical protein
MRREKIKLIIEKRLLERSEICLNCAFNPNSMKAGTCHRVLEKDSLSFTLFLSEEPQNMEVEII